MVFKRGGNIYVDRTAIQIEPSVNARKSLGQITDNVELATRLGSDVQIFCVIVVLSYDTVSLGIVQNGVTERDGILIFEENGECLFGFNRTAIIAIQRQGSSLSVIAPTTARGIGAHFNRLTTVDSDELVFFEYCTVFDVNVNRKVISSIPIIQTAVLYTNLNGSRVAGSRGRTGNGASAVVKRIPFRECSLQDFALPVVCIVIISTANTVKNIYFGVFLRVNGRKFDYAVAAPNKSLGRRFGVSKYRMLYGIALNVT